MRRATFLTLLCGLCVVAQPARVVSTSPSITETLFALGVGESVVGVSSYCRYPIQVRQIPKVGSYTKPNIERIASLRPGLVIIHKGGGELPNRLSALGIRYVEVEQGSLANLFSSTRTIGKAVQREKEAEAIIARIQSRIAATTAGVNGKQRPSVLMVVGKDRGQLTGIVVAGTSTYLGELLNAAGARNALEGTFVQTYPRISLETVMRLNPDVIIDSSGMGDEPNESDQRKRATLEPWLERRDLAAVRNGRITAILNEAIVVPGPRVLDALDMIANAIKGEHAR